MKMDILKLEKAIKDEFDQNNIDLLDIKKKKNCLHEI